MAREWAVGDIVELNIVGVINMMMMVEVVVPFAGWSQIHLVILLDHTPGRRSPVIGEKRIYRDYEMIDWACRVIDEG